ncbi:MAG: DUF4389 domain-containing protein [Proteobacteria bacterium]|jgi:hypothetical protein|nr:DUF4389 domain-containing protein [Alphaproteobacteria bacterium]NCC02616.1 DUF4389 domain-containing protein [Pseudomonadota bacterium]
MDQINEDAIKKHVKDKDTWLRFVYLVVFGFAFYLSTILTFAASIFQFLAKLFSGSIFTGLAEFGSSLATYQAQVTRYLTFASDEKPFPFAPFPNADASHSNSAKPTETIEAEVVRVSSHDASDNE